jgi:hypothetical protein
MVSRIESFAHIFHLEVIIPNEACVVKKICQKNDNMTLKLLKIQKNDMYLVDL